MPVVGPAGDFRVVMNDGAKGGQEVFHLHMHLIGTPYTSHISSVIFTPASLQRQPRVEGQATPSSSLPNASTSNLRRVIDLPARTSAIQERILCLCHLTQSPAPRLFSSKDDRHKRSERGSQTSHCREIAFYSHWVPSIFVVRAGGGKDMEKLGKIA